MMIKQASLSLTLIYILSQQTYCTLHKLFKKCNNIIKKMQFSLFKNILLLF